MNVLDLARPELLRLQPYSSARMEASGGNVWLNANELPWSQSATAARDLNRYPEPQPAALLEALAAQYAVSTTQLFVGRGSDEAIDLLTRGFCAAGASNVVISPPTFGMYAVAARIQGAAVREVPLLANDRYRIDSAGILAAVSAQTRLVHVCSPNNPTGDIVDAETLLKLADALRGRALLVVDEAYGEFSEEESASQLIDHHPHVVVLRTLSKAHGLAGARIGVALATAPVIQLMRNIMAPYPLPSPCIDAATAAMQPEALKRTSERVALLRNEREWLRRAIAGLTGVTEVLPSQANFLAVRFVDAEGSYARLASAGVIVRSLRKYTGLEDALRITIGTHEENLAVLSALDQSSRAA